jgi:hypothetical protein
MAHSEHALGNGPLDGPVSSHMGTSAQYREFATMRMEFQTETERHRRILKEMAEAWKELANAALACASSPTSACANEFLSRAATELQPSGGSRLTGIKVTHICDLQTWQFALPGEYVCQPWTEEKIPAAIAT